MSSLINYHYPIVGAELYANGLKVVREQRFPTTPVGGGKRKNIVKLSSASLSKLGWIACNSVVKWNSMSTLTYGQNYPICGKKTKRHLNHFLTLSRQRWQGVNYLWFLEFQLRGAPHFHVLWDLPATQANRGAVAHMWIRATGVQNWEYTRLRDRRVLWDKDAMLSVNSHEKALEEEQKPGGLSRYAIKYALKPRQKIVPKSYSNVGRFWGTSKGVRENIGRYVDLTEGELRDYLRDKGRNFDDFDVLPSKILREALTTIGQS